jgi:serine/threonine-protein kinase
MSRAAKAAAAAACIGLGAACASGPQVRTASPEKPCDPKVVEGMEKMMGFPVGYKLGNDAELWITDGEPEDTSMTPAPPEGPFTITVYKEFYGDRPNFTVLEGTRLHGQIFRGTDRLYGWVTDMEMPDGKHYPVCANLVFNRRRDELGHGYLPSSTPEKLLVSPFVNLAAAKSLGRLGK